MTLLDSERISMMRSAVLTQNMGVTDGQADGIAVAYTLYSIMLSRVKMESDKKFITGRTSL